MTNTVYLDTTVIKPCEKEQPSIKLKCKHSPKVKRSTKYKAARAPNLQLNLLLSVSESLGLSEEAKYVNYLPQFSSILHPTEAAALLPVNHSFVTEEKLAHYNKYFR